MTENGPDGNINNRERICGISIIYLLAALTLLIITFPIIEIIPNGLMIESVLLSLVLILALLTICNRRSTLIWGIILIIPALAGKWINYWRPDLMPAEIYLSAAILVFGFVVFHLLSFILGARRITPDILYAVMANYLLMGLLWAFSYLLVFQLIPNSFVFNISTTSNHRFKGFESVYFSFSTLSTVGFGDIIPVSSVSRMLAITESIVGVFYVAILVAQLVALYTNTKKP
ncbi:MAG: potassium channel family protein [Smithella sp.]